MYIKDKTNRITLRLNDRQMDFVTRSAEEIGVSPSEYLRLMITITQTGVEAERRENEQSNFDNKL